MKGVPPEDSVAARFPELVFQWHPSNDVLPGEVSYGSNRSVYWFRCPVDSRHVWKASVKSRTRMGQGCAVCRGTQVMAGVNDLATLRPDLATEWSPKNQVSPQEVPHHSRKKYIWEHNVPGSTHVWESTVDNRAKGQGCPVCAGQEVLAGYNDLASLAPWLMEEWDGDKNERGPHEYTLRSGQKVWWRCPQGHRYQAVIAARTSPNGSGCRACAIASGSSAPERYMRELLYQTDDWLFERDGASLPVSWGENPVAHVDAFGERVSEGPGLVVEYDGYYYHRDLARMRSDLKKTEALVESGYLVARLRETTKAFRLPDFPKHEHVLAIEIGSRSWRMDMPRVLSEVILWADSFAGCSVFST